ncbi:OmpA family protein [Xenophilus sp. Marseille-Q4582]|uniref:OmpA family protein n=1 Tax=Xenophilus sp. Marseille-Q4582 TaxID=2866600 RepID=UPI001CE3F593|nr:OmpA family protein [Xenophilus sp. Marseille-Q4582]
MNTPLHLRVRRPGWLAGLAAAVLLAGCAGTGQEGRDDTTYYYQARQAPNAVAPVTARPAPAPAAERGPVGVPRIVYFDFDKYEVKPQYNGVVQAHADYLRTRPQARVTLEGHTDVRGGSEYNLALGQRRADAVARLMGHGGAPQARMEAISWGKEKLASTEQTEAGHQLNRRVEFVYR